MLFLWDRHAAEGVEVISCCFILVFVHFGCLGQSKEQQSPLEPGGERVGVGMCLSREW